MEVIHIFNASIVSGPETLVLPSLPRMKVAADALFLSELRRAEGARGAREFAQSLGITTHEVHVNSRIDLSAIAELRRKLRELDPDIVHAHDVKASTYALLASCFPGRRWRLVSTHHGVRGRSGLTVRAYENFYVRCVLPFFDRVLAVCSSDRKLLLARGLKSLRVVTHLNGVDRTSVDPASRDEAQHKIRAAWELKSRGIPQNSLIIGFAGRLAPEKRLDRVIQIARELMKSHPSLPRWDIVVFGSGALLEDLRREAHAAGVDERLHWLGYRRGLGEEMAGFDLLISLSDAEGLPINLIEAGWAGTAILAIGADGNLDLVPDSSFGTLLSPESTDSARAKVVAELLMQPERLKKIGYNFQQRVQTHFSGECWRKELESIYESLR